MIPSLSNILSDLRNINLKQYNISIKTSSEKETWVSNGSARVLSDTFCGPLLAISLYNKQLEYFTCRYIITCSRSPSVQIADKNAYAINNMWQQYNHKGMVTNTEECKGVVLDNIDDLQDIIYLLEDWSGYPLMDQYEF